ncbi:phosphatase PAP2 family protein [Actinoplanes sp. GCM10030250]|uniref:phosphatase PAP2 family protein n=1 Tax=Actinoplanes sp. GCM10030250 TaxID=3273376 RepID=UPI00360C37ED
MSRLRGPVLEVIGLLLWFFLFTRAHVAVGRGVGARADANALTLQSVERALHLDIELAANSWLVAHPFLIPPSVYYYRLYYIPIIGALVWIYLRRADVYAHVRRVLLAMTALALPIFLAVPMSPPRTALPGMVDIIAEHDIVRPPSDQNVYSAMPSLHVGFSAWCAYALWAALRTSHPRLALVPWLFPLGMVADVLITANHYVLDIAGSAALLLASIAVAVLLNRIRPRALAAR